MRNHRWMVVAASCLVATAGLGGCGGASDGGAPLDAVPDEEALTLETGAEAELGAPALQGLGAAAAGADPSWPVTGADLAGAHEKVAAVNAALRSVLAHVAAVAAIEGAPMPGSGRWYGPVERCTVDASPCAADARATFRLWIGNAVGRGGAFVLQARAPAAGDADSRTVLAGWMRRGAAARRGVGQLWLDLEQLRLAAPAYPGRGSLLAGFAAGPRAKAETVALLGFTPDSLNPDWPAATVAFRGMKTATGTARVQVAGVKDLVPTTADTELGLAHAAYRPDLGGRVYTLVGNHEAGGVAHGDVPAGSYFLGRACYAPHAPDAPVFKQWFLCPAGQGPAACALDAGTPSFVEIGSSPSQCAVAGGEPIEFALPANAPGADPAAIPAPLPGEEDLGLELQPVPASLDEAPEPG